MEEIKRAVFEDIGQPPEQFESARRPAPEEEGTHRHAGTILLLETAFRLLGWRSEAEAADALGVPEEQLRAWRAGLDAMRAPDYLVLASRIGLWAAQALREADTGPTGRSSNL